MKFLTDLLQIEGKWSLSRVLLILMFFAIVVAWMTSLATVTTGMITIFGLLLGYSFGDKVQKNFEKIAHKKIDAETVTILE